MGRKESGFSTWVVCRIYTCAVHDQTGTMQQQTSVEIFWSSIFSMKAPRGHKRRKFSQIPAVNLLFVFKCSYGALLLHVCGHAVLKHVSTDLWESILPRDTLTVTSSSSLLRHEYEEATEITMENDTAAINSAFEAPEVSLKPANGAEEAACNVDNILTDSKVQNPFQWPLPVLIHRR